ncbi:hypothetical protein BIT89_004659 [Salmonella enterica subsp. enterica serovar Glostrup]|nr:hypothetical protein [Salmonella enterica subsp. enterica serovar Glostrup]
MLSSVMSYSIPTHKNPTDYLQLSKRQYGKDDLHVSDGGSVTSLLESELHSKANIQTGNIVLQVPLMNKPVNGIRLKTLASKLERSRDFGQIDHLNQSIDKVANSAGEHMNSALNGNLARPDLFGNSGILAALQAIISALNSEENSYNLQAASWSKTTVELAVQSGNHNISAAKDRMIGAISAGTVSMSLQGASTFSSIKALNTESKSITNNLGRSNTISRELQESQHSIQSSADSMVRQGESLEPNVQAAMSEAHPQSAFESAELRHNHMKVTNDTSKVRVTSDFVNQTANSLHSVVQSGAETSAATKIKEADIDRADQSVSNSIEDNDNRVSRKYSDSENSLRQALNVILNSTNDAVSFIAGRMA